MSGKLETGIGQIILSGEAECNASQNTTKEWQGKRNECEGDLRIPASDSKSSQDPGERSTLGWSSFNLFQRFGKQYSSKAPVLARDDDQDLPRRLTDEGTAFGARFHRLGEPRDLDKAIDHLLRALMLTPNGHPNMPYRLECLGVAYNDRFRRLGETEDLERAIEHRFRSVALTPNGDPDKPRRLEYLAVSHHGRFLRLGELEDLKKSIEDRNRALALTPSDHPDIPRRLDGLGSAYGDRFQRLGEPQDLDKAINYFSRALELTANGHPEMPHRLEGLGVAYNDRFRHRGEPEDLEKAIEHKSRSVALTPNNDSNIPRRLDGLGASCHDRFLRLGDPEDLEKSLKHRARALELTPDDHPDMPCRLDGLAVSYVDRFERLGKSENLDKAIKYYSRALALTPNGHPHMAHRLDGLGQSYGHRFQCLSELEDLEKAIESYSRALVFTPKGHPDMPGRHEGLGVSYFDRFQCLGKPDDLNKSIEHYSHGLALAPDGHPSLNRQHCNLAISYLKQFEHSDDPSLSRKALHHFRSATQLLFGAPRGRFQYALRWANHASTSNILNPIEAFQTTIDLLPQFIWLGATATQRYQDLATAENLAVNAANAAIRSSNYLLGLEWLEHARCVVWTQTLMLRSPLDQLHSCHPELATRLQTVTERLSRASSESKTQTVQKLSITPEQAGQQRRRLAQEYQSLLAQTRQLPGFEDFLQPMKANRLMHAARNGPVVVINSHSSCCDALVIMPKGNNVEHLHLPKFNNRKAQRARDDMAASLRRKGIRERGIKLVNEAHVKDRIGNVLETLWNDVVQPVLEFLGYINDTSGDNLPHITWCPTGTLSFLPLHAAGDYNQPRSRVFNHVVSSYTPTLTALLGSSLTSVSREYSVLAIGQPNTPGHNQLPGTAIELAYVRTHTQDKAEYTQLMGDQATIRAVLDAMEKHDWVHLACHAHQNVTDPTKSGFFLHDGTLDLASINQRSFKNKGLAFLSACQTATGDEKLPDEAVHLASGMLMAGYPSVIATMWSVGDSDAPLVADKVYGELMKEGTVGNGEAGKALHYAVAALRDKVGEKEFGRWVPFIHIGS